MATALSEQRIFHLSAITLVPNELESLNFDKTFSATCHKVFLAHCQWVEFRSSPNSSLENKVDDESSANSYSHRSQRPMLAIPLSTCPSSCTHAPLVCRNPPCIQPCIDKVISSIPGLTNLEFQGVLRSIQSHRPDDLSFIKHQTESYSLDVLLFTPHLSDDTQSSSSSSRETSSESYRTLQKVAQDVYSSSSQQQDTPLVPLIIHHINFTTTSTVSSSAESSSSYDSYSSLPTCPVCLFRIEPRFLGSFMNVPTHSQCSHTCAITDMNPIIEPSKLLYPPIMCRNLSYLLTTPTYPCKACPLIQQRMISTSASAAATHSGVNRNNHKDESSFVSSSTNLTLTCYSCQMKETLWVCLTCGMVGCGRYSMGHAEQHFYESNHPWALELATQRIWDYSLGSFVQRNDLLTCPLMRRLVLLSNTNTNPTWRTFHSSSPNRASNNNDHNNNNHSIDTETIIPTKDEDSLFLSKSQSIGEEYEVLLQSALEDQAQHYEDEISKLHILLASSNAHISSDPMEYLSSAERMEVLELKESITQLRQNIDMINQDLVEAQAKEAQYQAQSKVLLRQQELTQGILAQLQEQVRKEWHSAYAQIEDWEQQIQDLTNNIQMRQQILQHEELVQSQIVGCTTTSQEDIMTGSSKIKRRGMMKKDSPARRSK